MCMYMYVIDAIELNDGQDILVPRGCAPFGQHQESQPLGGSNTGSLQIMDSPSLCAWSELI